MKRLLVVAVSVLCAISLVSVEFTQDADALVGTIIGSLVVGAIIGWLVNDWLTDDDNYFEIHQDYSATVLDTHWQNYENKFTENYNYTNSMLMNMVEQAEAMGLYLRRGAEREVIDNEHDLLTNTSWTTWMTNQVCAEIDNLTINMFDSILCGWTNLMMDFVNELNQLYTYSFSETDSYANAYISCHTCTEPYIRVGKWYQGGWQSDYITKSYLIVDGYHEEMKYNATSTSCGLGDTYYWVADFSNPDFDIGTYLNSAHNLELVWYTLSKGDSGVWSRLKCIIPDADGYGYVFKATFRNDSEAYKTLISGLGYGAGNKFTLEQPFDALRTAMNSIRDNAVADAQAYWAWCHTQGWYSADDVSAEDTPVYPDVLDIDWSAYNFTDELAQAIYYDWMSQLANQSQQWVLNNMSGIINYGAIDLANITANYANITLREANATSGSGDIIYSGNAFLMPFETTTFNISTCDISVNASKPAWADYMFDSALRIYCWDDGRFLTYHPTNDTHYNLTTHGLYEDGDAVTNYTVTLVDAVDLFSYFMGYNFTGGFLNPDNQTVITVTTSDDYDYLAMVLGGLGIVIAVVGSKNKGVATIGALMVVAGVGVYLIAHYWDASLLSPLDTIASTINGWFS